MSIILNKHGLFKSHWDNEINDDVIEGMHSRWSNDGSFFISNWNEFFEIEEGVLFKDLVDLLLSLSDEEIHILSSLADANLKNYIDDVRENPDPITPSDTRNTEYIEVYRSFEIDNYDTLDDTYKIGSDYTCAHGVGKPWDDEHSMTLPPEERGNVYAIEFVPWQELFHMPVKIRKEIYYRETEWVKTEPRDMEFGVLGSDRKVSLGITDRAPKNFITRKVTGHMTMGQFFHGLFNELCFFSSPVSRQEQSDVLSERIEEVEEILAEEKKNDLKN